MQHSPHHSLHTYMHGSVLAYYAHICTRTQVFQCAAQSSQPVTHIRMVAYYAHKCTRTQASLCAAQTYNLGCTYIHTHTGSSVCSKTTRCCGTSSRTTISTPPKPSPGVVSVQDHHRQPAAASPRPRQCPLTDPEQAAAAAAAAGTAAAAAAAEEGKRTAGAGAAASTGVEVESGHGWLSRQSFGLKIYKRICCAAAAAVKRFCCDELACLQVN